MNDGLRQGGSCKRADCVGRKACGREEHEHVRFFFLVTLANARVHPDDGFR